MISERQLSNGFQDLWREALPLLTPNFVHLFNECYKVQLVNAAGTPAKSVPVHKEANAAIVAEFAFHLARLAYSEGIPLGEVSANGRLLNAAESESLLRVNMYQRSEGEIQRPMSKIEREEGLLILRNYEVLLSPMKNDELEFNPRIPGCGFVDACAPDLSIQSCLFEIKTVNRRIAAKDIRQLVAYLALQAATGVVRWQDAGFFNPRRAVWYKFSPDKVIPMISGGRLVAEVFQKMIDYFCNRDFQLDSMF